MEAHTTQSQEITASPMPLALQEVSPQPEKGAIGVAFLVWLFGGGLGLALLVFIFLKMC